MKIIKAQVRPLTKIDGEQILQDIQYAAKTCYKSHKETDNMESAMRICRQLLASGHLSPLEFATITMQYTSNIATYKDLTRHRMMNFCIESTRWNAYNKGKFGGELTFLQPAEIPADTLKYQVWLNGCQQAEKNYMDMMSLGGKPDESSLLLPQSTAGTFVMRGNIRAWRDVLALRAVGTTGKPRPSVLEIMQPTLELFHKKIPVLFDDLYEQMIQKQGR